MLMKITIIQLFGDMEQRFIYQTHFTPPNNPTNPVCRPSSEMIILSNPTGLRSAGSVRYSEAARTVLMGVRSGLRFSFCAEEKTLNQLLVPAELSRMTKTEEQTPFPTNDPVSS